MKIFFLLAASLLALNLMPAFGQQTGAIYVGNPLSFDPATGLPLPDKTLTKFNLDFPGGTPKELVAAIEKAMGKPLNVIINKEDENIEIPPLKMNDVYVPQLFTALEVISRKLIQVSGVGFNGYSQYGYSYGFKSADNMSDSSVWYFHVEKPPQSPVVSTVKVCQFYSLAPYLDRGFTVDDITTAIQTGWKMLGDASPPEISFHKETKLLIAVGEPDKLKVIDNVLKELGKSDYKLPPSIDPNTGLPLSTIEPKTEKSGK